MLPCFFASSVQTVETSGSFMIGFSIFGKLMLVTTATGVMITQRYTKHFNRLSSSLYSFKNAMLIVTVTFWEGAKVQVLD